MSINNYADPEKTGSLVGEIMRSGDFGSKKPD